VGYDHELFRTALRDNANKNGRELHSLMHLQHVLNALRLLDRTPGGEILEIGAGRAGLPVVLLACGFDRVHVNEISGWRADHMPYGGVKDSGYGKEGPAYAMAEMTHFKTVSFRTG